MMVDLSWGKRFWLRLKYGGLDLADYRQLLKATLSGNVAEDGDALRQLLFDCGFGLRPRLHGKQVCPPDDMRWKYWVSLALRYFPTLVNNSYGPVKSNTISNVRDWLEHDRKLIQAFLFGNRELVSAILTDGFDSASWQETLPIATSEQASILAIVQYHMSSTGLSERQVGNWTNELLDEWAEELLHVLQVSILREFSKATQRIFGRLSGIENPSDPIMFEEYLSRFQAANLDWAYGQALGYHNELKHRYRRAGQLAPWVAAGGIGSTIALVVAISIRMLNGSFILQILLAGMAGLGLIVVILNLIRIGYLILGLSGKVEYQLQTLEQIAEAYLPNE